VDDDYTVPHACVLKLLKLHHIITGSKNGGMFYCPVAFKTVDAVRVLLVNKVSLSI